MAHELHHEQGVLVLTFLGHTTGATLISGMLEAAECGTGTWLVDLHRVRSFDLPPDDLERLHATRATMASKLPPGRSAFLMRPRDFEIGVLYATLIERDKVTRHRKAKAFTDREAAEAWLQEPLPVTDASA